MANKLVEAAMVKFGSNTMLGDPERQEKRAARKEERESRRFDRQTERESRRYDRACRKPYCSGSWRRKYLN